MTSEIKNYVIDKVEALRTEINIKIDALKEATTIAKTSLDERLSHMNEFRDALKDQTATFINRKEHEILIQSIDIRINEINCEIQSLKESKARLEGKADQSSVNTSLIIAIIGIVISVSGLVLHFIGG